MVQSEGLVRNNLIFAAPVQPEFEGQGFVCQKPATQVLGSIRFAKTKLIRLVSHSSLILWGPIGSEVRYVLIFFWLQMSLLLLRLPDTHIHT